MREVASSVWKLKIITPAMERRAMMQVVLTAEIFAAIPHLFQSSIVSPWLRKGRIKLESDELYRKQEKEVKRLSALSGT
jgi:hypothetical protein